MAEFQAPKGTFDVLPPVSARYARLIAMYAQHVERAGYGLVISPMFEDVGVFNRVGESTDVVRKEMYDFEDKGGRRVALRPEGTAGVARAFAQHHPVVPWKVWYVAPHFRYERPQKGRYRQHFQVGAEALGVEDPQLDVEVIALAHGFYRALGLRDFTLSINSMGDEADRARYAEQLTTYLLQHGDALGDTFRERVAANPIRVLDSKDPDWQDVIERAPQITECLGNDARAHFEAVQHGLDRLGIAHEIDPRLVRGLDYYTSTTFEFSSQALEAAQNGIGRGGRYDGLVEQMGGKPTPGIGFGIGIERVLIACAAEDVAPGTGPTADVFVLDRMENPTEVTLLVTELREDGMRADRTYGGRAFRKQMDAANKSGARYAVVMGRDEAEHGAVGVKDMQTGEQVEIPRQLVAGWVQERLEADPRTEVDTKR